MLMFKAVSSNLAQKISPGVFKSFVGELLFIWNLANQTFRVTLSLSGPLITYINDELDDIAQNVGAHEKSGFTVKI